MSDDENEKSTKRTVEVTLNLSPGTAELVAYAAGNTNKVDTAIAVMFGAIIEAYVAFYKVDPDAALHLVKSIKRGMRAMLNVLDSDDPPAELQLQLERQLEQPEQYATRPIEGKPN